jgi:hypothetical protein
LEFAQEEAEWLHRQSLMCSKEVEV